MLKDEQSKSENILGIKKYNEIKINKFLHFLLSLFD